MVVPDHTHLLFGIAVVYLKTRTKFSENLSI